MMQEFLGVREDPLKPELDPAIWVEPRDSDLASEYDRQRQLLGFLRKYAPRLFVFSIPNATRGVHSKLRQQREGAVYGAPDLVLTWVGGTGFIEMKNGTSKPEPHQVDFLNRLAQQGHHVAVCRTMERAVDWLRIVGAPVPAIRG